VQSTGNRTTPDVAFVADPGTGVWIADTYNLSADSPWEVVGGTSLSAPSWAGLIALVDQGRTAAGEATLSSSSGIVAQQALYGLPQTDFNSITSGTNGAYTAAAGYNLVTGLGTPVANLLVPDLIAYQATSPANQTAADLPASSGGSGSGGSGATNVVNVFNVFDVVTGEGGDVAGYASIQEVGDTARIAAALADGGSQSDAGLSSSAGLPEHELPMVPRIVDAGEARNIWSEGTLLEIALGGETTPVAPTANGAAWQQGGYGDDVLIGGDGTDVMIGGEGRGLLVGGIGRGQGAGSASSGIAVSDPFDKMAADLAAAMNDSPSGSAADHRDEFWADFGTRT